jgi:hypothetical protein
MALLAPKRTLVLGGALIAVLVLYVLGSEKKREDTTQPAANPSQCRVTITVDGLRVREAPNTEAKIVGRFNRGNETDADKLVQNGFRKIGDNRWVSAEFTQPLSGRDCG